MRVIINCYMFSNAGRSDYSVKYRNNRLGGLFVCDISFRGGVELRRDPEDQPCVSGFQFSVAVRVGEQKLQLAERFKPRGGAKRKARVLRGDFAVLVHDSEGEVIDRQQNRLFVLFMLTTLF